MTPERKVELRIQGKERDWDAVDEMLDEIEYLSKIVETTSTSLLQSVQTFATGRAGR